ncbi:hypothetical protein [Marimonas arenosa]|uniref:Uncharacterized protein n=1 Tax=Marimonas arenosa TaxID=1795305 RepID=A0AAE3WGX6_9RHOB|nr:hypothetical protein [Marimonas arenosa]MDQ2092439.1 hypothetical protein [Marimonas arenosa]
MAVIDNPRHSRPIDVHRWSEHPEVKALVDTIWESYLPPQITEQGPGPKPRTAFRRAGSRHSLRAQSESTRGIKAVIRPTAIPPKASDNRFEPNLIGAENCPSWHKVRNTAVARQIRYSRKQFEKATQES